MRFFIRSVVRRLHRMNSILIEQCTRFSFFAVAAGTAAATAAAAATVHIENSIKWQKRFRRCTQLYVHIEHHVRSRLLLVYQRDKPNHFVELNRIAFGGEKTMSKQIVVPRIHTCWEKAQHYKRRIFFAISMFRGNLM